MTEQDKDRMKPHKEEVKEVGTHLQNQEDNRIEVSSEQLITLADYGYLPKELVEHELNQIKEIQNKIKLMNEFHEKNPNIPKEEVCTHFFKKNPLSSEDEIKLHEDIAKSMQLYEKLKENIDLLKPGALDEIPSKLFRSLQSGEFGIARLACDPLNQVPALLKNETSAQLIQEDIYQLKWECDNSGGDSIRLQHRFRAINQDDADKQAQAFVKRLTGRQKKVYESCWAMANKKIQRIYTCELVELMDIAYPKRKEGSPFSVKERVEFYQDLLELSQTQFIITKKLPANKRKNKIESFLLPFITIHKFTEDAGKKESERYPNQISLSVLYNPLYKDEKMYNVGAAIKYSTLELHSDDMYLAEWIQIRKSQKNEEESKYISLDREFLIRLAKLDGIQHSGMANKKLIEKLERLKEKEIILDYPKRITHKIHLKIR